MSSLGKVLGGLLGLMLGARLGWIGSLLLGFVGYLLGDQFDRGWRPRAAAGPGRIRDPGRAEMFFETTFLVMGHLAKADGRVSEEEIQAARGAMHRMRLQPEAVRRAIELFTAGKQPGFDLGEQLARFRRSCGQDPGLVRTFLVFQYDLVLSKGAITPQERALLWQIASQLGVGRVELAQLEAVLRAQRGFGGTRPQTDTAASLAEAYRALGVEATASDREVKTAYRRLMNQHHPDKLVARGLPESMLEAAKERTREIRAAYEVIRSHRGLK